MHSHISDNLDPVPFPQQLTLSSAIFHLRFVRRNGLFSIHYCKAAGLRAERADMTNWSSDLLSIIFIIDDNRFYLLVVAAL